MTRKIHYIIAKLYFRYLLSVLWTVVILFLSLMHVPENKDLKINIPHLDKLVHMSMYFIYSFIILYETKNNQKKSAITIIALYSILFGVLMELCQMYFFSYRSGDVFDGIFNSIGVFLSILLFPKVMKFIKP